jgi:hypothetical protein
MIDKIKKHPVLKSFTASRCEENKISVSMAEDIPPGNYVVLKVDEYYRSLKLGRTPPSIDCLVPVKCSTNGFFIYLIELKNIKSPKGFTINGIYSKFKTTIEDFMAVRFADIFLDRSYKIDDMKLYFFSNHYGLKPNRLREISHRREGTKMEALLFRKPFKFRDQVCQLENEPFKLVIENC